MNSRRLTIFVSGLVLLLVAAGVAGAFAGRLPSLPAALGESVSSGITYQGRLTDNAGQPLNETVTMRFVVYDDDVAGSAQWDSGNMNVAVEDGLFTVKLGVDAGDFDGQALWLSIIVEGQVLSPRQEITPAPYALGLRPGADIVGEAIGPLDAALAGYTPATGTAFYGEGNGGAGMYGASANSYGVRGASDNSWGGYFTSNEGYGLRVVSLGKDHWDHSGSFEAEAGYGLYATSANNMAIRGEAGDTTGLWQPVGNVGVVGIGQSRGVYGSGGSSYGMYSTSLDWYGIYARTSRPDHNYGLYTPDNLYSSNVNMAGATMQVAQNGGSEAIEPGDVVVFSGLVKSENGGTPIVQVAHATEASSQAVAGVVHSAFNEAVLEDNFSEEALMKGDVEVTAERPVGPGDYLLLVIQGPAQVKVGAVESAIRPGDLLSTSAVAGRAMPAPQVEVAGATIAPTGVVLGKALESGSGQDGMIYVFVTLQ